MVTTRREEQTQGHLIEWSQTNDEAILEIGQMYGLEQKEYESIDEYSQRIMHIAMTKSEEEYEADLEEVFDKEDNEVDQMIDEEVMRMNWDIKGSEHSTTYKRNEQGTWHSPYNSQYYKPQTQAPIRIMGIDPGISNIGWCILEYDKVKWEYKYIKSGKISTTSLHTDGAKYTQISDKVYELLLAESPIKQMAIENLFYHKNSKTANKTAGAIAIIQMVAHHSSIEPIMVSPTDAKKASTGSGKADKNLVIKSVNETMNLEIKGSHEADAIAICMAAIFQENREAIKAEKERKSKHESNTSNTNTKTNNSSPNENQHLHTSIQKGKANRENKNSRIDRAIKQHNETKAQTQKG